MLPVLTYGIEIIIPSEKLIEKLELFQKKSVKQILSLPTNVADSSVYILSGLLPIEAVYHLKVLNFFNNICNQSESSIERQILIRQLTVKSDKSYSWAARIQPLLTKYDLGDIFTFVDHPLNKLQWKKKVHVKIVEKWRVHIENIASNYSSLKRMNITYTPGKFHPTLRIGCSSYLEVTRIPAKLRLLTGTYILQG